MRIRTFNRGEAQKAMEEWILNYPSLPNIDSELMDFRNDIQNLNKQVRETAKKREDIKRNDYYIDTQFGLKLYDYLLKQFFLQQRL